MGTIPSIKSRRGITLFGYPGETKIQRGEGSGVG